MARPKTVNTDLPPRVSRIRGALRYRRPDQQGRDVSLAGIDEGLALRFCAVLAQAFGTTTMRGGRHLYRLNAEAFDWSGVDQEVRRLARAKLPELFPKLPAKPDGRKEQDRHGWAYAPPDRAALRHQLTPLTEKQAANAVGLPWVKTMFLAARKNAVSRGIAFGIELEDVAALVMESKGRCTVTGIALATDRGELATGRRMRRPWAPSLDRMDSEQGYTRENCRVVCCAANYAMSQWGEAVLVEMAKAIARKRVKVVEG